MRVYSRSSSSNRAASATICRSSVPTSFTVRLPPLPAARFSPQHSTAFAERRALPPECRRIRNDHPAPAHEVHKSHVRQRIERTILACPERLAVGGAQHVGIAVHRVNHLNVGPLRTSASARMARSKPGPKFSRGGRYQHQPPGRIEPGPGRRMEFAHCSQRIAHPKHRVDAGIARDEDPFGATPSCKRAASAPRVGAK